MNWDEFEAAAPVLAATARELLVDADVALLGTLRREGAPRISCVQPCILEGALYLGMMWRSRKAVDLARDPRLVLRNAICSNTGAEVELSLTGLAVAMTEPGLRQRFVRAVEERTAWTEPHFHLFAVDIRGVALVACARGEQLVRVGRHDPEPVGMVDVRMRVAADRGRSRGGADRGSDRGTRRARRSESEPVQPLAVLQNRSNPITGPASLAAPYHEVIAKALERGLSAQRIWQDLVEEHGYGGGYLTVQRYVRGLKRVRPEVAEPAAASARGMRRTSTSSRAQLRSWTQPAVGVGPGSSG